MLLPQPQQWLAAVLCAASEPQAVVTCCVAIVADGSRQPLTVCPHQCSVQRTQACHDNLFA